MRNLKKTLLIFGTVGAVSVAALTGCQSWGNKGGSDRSEGRIVDDNRINAEVEHKLQNEPIYKFTEVDVKTFNGVVQLSGFATTEEQKTRAADLARSVSGVASVVNSIALKSQMMPTGGNQPFVHPGTNDTPVQAPVKDMTDDKVIQ
jgi:hypothetical protein